MHPYLILAAAIISEVFGSTLLKVSSGFKKLLPVVGLTVGYVAAFYLLSLALKTIPLGTAYAIWSGVGTALTALVGIFWFKEGFNFKKGLGLVMIIIGVAVLNLGSSQ